MESYSKYGDMPRQGTCMLIDEPAIVLMGRTFNELLMTVGAFVLCAYVDHPGIGLLVAGVVGGLIPMYRIRYARGFVQHLAWSCGLWYPEVGLFTVRRMTRSVGP